MSFFFCAPFHLSSPTYMPLSWLLLLGSPRSIACIRSHQWVVQAWAVSLSSPPPCPLQQPPFPRRRSSSILSFGMAEDPCETSGGSSKRPRGGSKPVQGSLPRMRRVSRRLLGLPPSSSKISDSDDTPEGVPSTASAAKVLQTNSSVPIDKDKASDPDMELKSKQPPSSKILEAPSLPRTQEDVIRQKLGDTTIVLGIDEAGRGPLAGPVGKDK